MNSEYRQALGNQPQRRIPIVSMEEVEQALKEQEEIDRSDSEKDRKKEKNKNGARKEEPETPKAASPVQIANPQDYIIVTGVNGLYGSQSPIISKFELQGMNGMTWENTHIKLHQSGLYMPPSRIFMQHFENVVDAYYGRKVLIHGDLSPVAKRETEEIYKHLTTNFKDIYGKNNPGAWTWLNDFFEQDEDKWFIKQVIGIENGKLKFANRKSLESCLDKDTFADFKIRNSQGLFTQEKGSSYLQGENVYFYKPGNGAVAGFYADSDGAGLYCYGNPAVAYSSLGVFACAEGTPAKKI